MGVKVVNRRRVLVNPIANPEGVVRRKMSREEMAETPHAIDKSGRAVLEDGSVYIWDSRFEQWSMWAAPRRANPRRKSGIPEYVEPGTKMFLNDSWSVNAEVEVLEWNHGHSDKIGYGDTYDKALVRKIYFNKERVVRHYQLSFEPR